MFLDEKKLKNIRSRTSRQIYGLALPLHAPEMLSSLSNPRISIFIAHLTLLVRRMMSHNSFGKYRYIVNCLRLLLDMATVDKLTVVSKS